MDIVIDIINFDLVHFNGLKICCPEGKDTTGLQVPLQGAPLQPPPIYIRKTATAPGSPYSYTNSAWVL